MNWTNLDKSPNAIRLSTLNPAVRERVEKFDIGNDGAIDVNEALQGLVTLQKQSNNYKKMIWFLIPVICLVLAGTFGTTILAINMTKEVKQTNGLLTSDATNTPIRTLLADSRDVMYSSMFSEDYNLITKIHIGKHSLGVKSVFQKDLDSTSKVVYVITDMVNFVWNQTGEFVVQYNSGFENNAVAQVAFEDVVFALSQHQKLIQEWGRAFNVSATLDEIADSQRHYQVSTSKQVSSNYQYNAGVISTMRMATPELLKKVSDLQALIAASAKLCNDQFASCQKKLFSSFTKCRNELNTCLANTPSYVQYTADLNAIWGSYQNFCLTNYKPDYWDCHIGFCGNDVSCKKCVIDLGTIYNDIFKQNCPDSGP